MVTKVTSTCLSEGERSLAIKALRVLYPDIEYVGDLSHEVNVLIVNPSASEKSWIKSAKFQYAVSYRPDIIVMSLEAVLELLKKRKTNPNMKTPMILELPSIKPFDGLKVSICRLEDKLEDKITNMVERNGGIVATSLATDTDLMISMFSEGKRYETALKWEIPVVSPDWCYDSVERGLFLNPKWYILPDDFTGIVKKIDIDGDEDKNERTVKIYKMGNREEACDWEKLEKWNKQKEKFRLEERVRLMLKEGIGKEDTKSFDNLSVNLKRNRKVQREENHSDDYDDDDDDETERIVNMKRFQKGRSKMRTLMTKRISEPIQKSLFIGEQFSPLEKKETSFNGALFQGMKFKTIGFTDEETNKLKRVLAKFGGQVIPNGMPNFTIVNFKFNDSVDEPNCITDLAIERFLYMDSIEYIDGLWFRPFSINTDLDISTFRKSFMGTSLRPGRITVSFTGFKGSDLLHLERLVKERFQMWFEHRENFSKEVEVLVYNSKRKRVSPTSHSGRKLELAKKWKIRSYGAEQFFNKVVHS